MCYSWYLHARIHARLPLLLTVPKQLHTCRLPANRRNGSASRCIRRCSSSGRISWTGSVQRHQTIDEQRTSSAQGSRCLLLPALLGLLLLVVVRWRCMLLLQSRKGSGLLGTQALRMVLALLLLLLVVEMSPYISSRLGAGLPGRLVLSSSSSLLVAGGQLLRVTSCQLS
jgi:hypothetical protein